MTPKDSVRAAAESARETARHAADAMAPYAGSVKGAAVHYAHEANERLAPMVAHAAHEASRQARTAYDTHLHPRMRAARAHVPPNVDHAATRAACRTREAVRHAAAVTQPRLEHALAVAQPMAEEAASRSTAALAALRGQVSAHEVEKLMRGRARRARAGRVVKGIALVGLLAGAAYLAWRWWDQQSNPDWLVEPPAATEVPSRDAAESNFDEELAAKEREASSSADDQQQ
ncbi:DUF5324 family protein [Streptomyces antimicrobicus]|uniref:DUF5324 family protein n=1 Tax=Streptomyces antimicrobicus TaxID=2883108 RepID=A0ABS8B0G6_9ACTN|nr:DUF5324 family protein [Streptomyces antimicrobicus]MCB5178110.1 DUF5324 family protein [Streptomyces antimicrobicus]